MNSSFGIIQSVLCSSPVRPIAPGCVYGESQALPPALLSQYVAVNRLDKISAATLGPNIISVEEGQEARRKKAEKEAAAAAAAESGTGLHPLVYLGGLGAAVALGVGIFIYVRKRRQG